MGYDIVKGGATAARWCDFLIRRFEPIRVGLGHYSEQPFFRKSRDDLRLHEIPLGLEGIFRLIEIIEDSRSRWLREKQQMKELERVEVPSIEVLFKKLSLLQRMLLPGGSEEELRSQVVRKFEEIPGKISAQSVRAFIREKNFSTTQSLQFLQFFGGLTNTTSSNLSKSGGSQDLIYCIRQVLYQILVEKVFSYFVSTAVVVLCLLEYLMGYIERGGWATYSDTSWEFRATYVSIELRLAAYFWFKFRAWPVQPSSANRSGCKRARGEKGTPSVSYRDKRNKYEPRLKDSHTKKAIWLGEYDTHEEATDAYWIGAFYHNQLDRFSEDDLKWWSANLPQAPVGQMTASWVREQAASFLMRKRHPVLSVQGEEGNLECYLIDDILRSSSLFEDTEDVLQGIMNGGLDSMHVDPPAMSDAGEGDPIPQDARVSAPCGGYPFGYEEQTSFMQEFELAGGIELGHGACPEQDVENLQQSLGSALQLECGDTDYMPQARSGGIDQADNNMTGSFDLGQYDYSQEITVHGYNEDVIVNRSREGEVSRLDVGSEDLNLSRTYGDESASHQQGIGQGNIVAEVGALRQDETEDHSALRASADNIQAMVLPIAAQKINEKRFRITDTIRSTLRELHDEKGVNFSIRPLASTEFSIAFPEGLQLTASNIFALEEIHEQGFEIILEFMSNASLQDANGRPQSGSSSQDLCRSCCARLSVE